MSTTPKRYSVLLLALLMALGMVATTAPAAADFLADSGTVVFRGHAKIGNNWEDTNPEKDELGNCDWEELDENGDPTGQANGGLNFPDPLNLNDNDGEKCYAFSAPEALNGHPIDGTCMFAGIVNGNPIVDECEINAEGELKGALLFGAPHCGISSSNGGRGFATLVENAPKGVQFFNLGWTSSAGSVLPVTGSWDALEPHKKKGPRKLTVLVQALGTTKEGTSLPDACDEHKGADSFDVNGVGELSPVPNLPEDVLSKEADPTKHPKKPPPENG